MFRIQCRTYQSHLLLTVTLFNSKYFCSTEIKISFRTIIITKYTYRNQLRAYQSHLFYHWLDPILVWFSTKIRYYQTQNLNKTYHDKIINYSIHKRTQYDYESSTFDPIQSSLMRWFSSKIKHFLQIKTTPPRKWRILQTHSQTISAYKVIFFYH